MRWRPLAATLAAFLAVGVGWWLAGWVVAALGLDALDLPARACAVFLFLRMAETVQKRLVPA